MIRVLSRLADRSMLGLEGKAKRQSNVHDRCVGGVIGEIAYFSMEVAKLVTQPFYIIKSAFKHSIEAR